jgi:hypothetical protein
MYKNRRLCFETVCSLTKQKPAPYLRRSLAGLLLQRPVFVSRSVSDLWLKNSIGIGSPHPKYFSTPCATSRKDTCLIPDAVVGMFHWITPSGRTMALGSTQPLTDLSTRDVSCGVEAVLQISYFEFTEISGKIYVLRP